MNRIALHQSTVHPLDPIALVQIAQGAGIDSIGLRVAAAAEVEQWWSKGIGSRMLHDLLPALLGSRVTMLDVGRVVLGPELRTVDSRHAYMRVLELGSRLGAQFLTARTAAGSTDDQAELFGLLAALATPYRLRPLITVVPGSPVDSIHRALDVVAGTHGGVVLDVSPLRHTQADVDDAVVELGDALGYVRVPAREVAGTSAPGLLATLPPQIPVAIGGQVTGDVVAAPTGDDHARRSSALRLAVDEMLRHPRSAGARSTP